MFELQSFVIGIILMLKKYTLINITINEEPCDEDYKNGIMLLPIIGLTTGFFACFIMAFKIFYDSFFVSVIVFMYYCIITKTVSLIDSYKVLNYYIKPKKSSEQLSGILGILIMSMLYISLMRLVNIKALIIMTTAGYSGLIITSSYIDRDKECTSVMKYCGKYHRLSAFIISFAAAVIINYRLVIPLALTYMIMGVTVKIIDKRIKLLPSSIEGFIIEITQLIFITVTYLFKII